jgi:hypothetical protein
MSGRKRKTILSKEIRKIPYDNFFKNAGLNNLGGIRNGGRTIEMLYKFKADLEGNQPETIRVGGQRILSKESRNNKRQSDFLNVN